MIDNTEEILTQQLETEECCPAEETDLTEEENLPAAAESGTEEEESTQEEKAVPVNQGIVSIIRMLAGGYLIYLAWDLLKNFYENISGGWNKEMVICLLAGILFVGIGGYLLVKYLISYYKYNKQFQKKR